MKKYFNLAQFELRKKSNIFSIIMISLAICFVVVLCSYKKTQDNYYTNDVFNGYYYRLLNVEKKDKNKEEAIKELKRLAHVTNAIYSPFFQNGAASNNLKNDRLNGGVWFIASNNESLPQIISGTNFPDDENYYMICPKNFFPGNTEEMTNIKTSDTFPISSYLNQIFSFDYYGKMYNGTSAYKYKIDIKLVGIYENNKYFTDEDTCYVNEKTLKDFVINVYKDDIDEKTGKNNLTYQTGITIVIDDYRNLESVKQELEKLGYDYSPMAFLDFANINSMYSNINAILIFIVILMFLLIFLLLEKDFKENREYYQLLHYLGYYKKEIRKVYVLASVIKLFFCLFMGIIISLFLLLVVFFFLQHYPYLLGKINFEYSFVSVLFVILSLIISLLVNVLLNIKVVNKSE